MSRGHTFGTVRRRVAAVALGLMVIASTIGASPSAAATRVLSPRTIITLVGDSGTWVLGDIPRYVTSRDFTVTTTTTANRIDVHAERFGERYDLTFAARSGQRLTTGLYQNAVGPDAGQAARPGLRIAANSRGCNLETGRFDVKDLVTSSTGALQRLWVTFHQVCDNHVPTLFGEIRIGAPGPSAAHVVSPRVVWWPATYPNRTAYPIPITEVPVTFLATGTEPVTVARSAVTGIDAADFPILADGCTGRTLAPGAKCAVRVAFKPSGVGPRYATLSIDDSRGGGQRVTLNGAGIAGRTRLEVTSEPGDFVGQGKHSVNTPERSYITTDVSLHPHRVELTFGDNVNDGTQLSFAVPPEQALTVGNYPVADRGAGRPADRRGALPARQRGAGFGALRFASGPGRVDVGASRGRG